MPASIRDQLIADHMNLASAAASKVCFGYRPNDPHWQDAHSAALEALVKAADAFDPERGCRFITLAWPRLMRAVQRVRIRERQHYELQTTRANGYGDGDGDGGNDGRSVAEVASSALTDSPEELLLRAEAYQRGEDRLRRLPGELREKVEVTLDGGAALLSPQMNAVYTNRHTGERVTYVRPSTVALILDAAGVRVGAKDRKAVEGVRKTHAQRQAEYAARRARGQVRVGERRITKRKQGRAA